MLSLHQQVLNLFLFIVATLCIKIIVLNVYHSK